MGMGVSGGGGSSRRRGSSRRAPMAEINVTPLVDVMLVLLIIFMVTAPLLTAGIPVQLPDSRAKSLPTEKEPTTISVAADGNIYIDKEKVSLEGLPTKLEAIGADDAGEKPQITLRADKAIDYGRVMAVMGELNRAGFARIAMVTNMSGDAGEDTPGFSSIEGDAGGNGASEGE